MKTFHSLFPLFGSLALCVSVNAANVVLQDVLLTDSSGFAPSDSSSEVGANDASNATALGTFKASSGLQVIQNFAFSGNQNLSSAYVYSFADSALPDFRLTYGGTINTGGAVNVNNTAFATSAGSSMRVGGIASSATLFRLDVGSYNVGSDTFSAVGGVKSLGFTLSGNFSNTTAAGLSISYFNASDQLLGPEQTIAGGGSGVTTTVSNNGAGYTALVLAASDISYALISFTSGGNAGTFGLDDLAFAGYASVPEPASFAAVAGLLVMGTAVSRRRRSAPFAMSL